MKTAKRVILILTTLLLVLPLSYTNAESKNDTPKTEETPEKTKIDIMHSALCVKCKCDAENSLIDCTDKLDKWFSEAEWDILQNGDIVFDTIKMAHNNFTEIPLIKTYGLKNLYLDNNQITSIALGAFKNLTQLIKLDLSHNNLTSKVLLPDVFKGPYSENDFEPLKNLRSLNLGYNQLHNLNDDLFEHVPNLEELILCSNTLQVVDKLTETALLGLTELKILDISYMELNSLPETIFHGPRDLEILIASGNLFTEVPKAFSYAKNLGRLVLDENPIDSLEGENVFPEMPNLKYLSISYMPDLYKIGQAAFSDLQNLTEIILSDNKRLAIIENNAFSKNITGGNYLDYAPIEKVYLRNCNLTTIPNDLLIRWDKVTVLDLRYNPWNCDSSNEFMINYLIQQVNKTSPLLANNVKCKFPNELSGLEALQVFDEKLLETSPNGSLVWISLLVCVLLAIPIALAGVIIYRRGYCGLRRKNEAARRALYSRTSFNEDFHI